MNRTTMLPLMIALLLPMGCDPEPATESRAAEVSIAADQACNRVSAQMVLELVMSLGGLDQDEQMAQSYSAATQRHEESRAAHTALLQAMAEAVETGTLATDGLNSERDVFDATLRAEGEALAIAIEMAHGLVSPEVRAAVIDMLPEPPADVGGAPPMDGDAMGDMPPPPPGLMGPILDAVRLDQSQHEALRSALGMPPPPMTPPDFDAFVDDDFDVTTLDLPTTIATIADAHTSELIRFVVTLTPLLDEAQLAAMVSVLRDPPPPPEHEAMG